MKFRLKKTSLDDLIQQNDNSIKEKLDFLILKYISGQKNLE